MTRRLERVLWGGAALFIALAAAGWRSGQQGVDPGGRSTRAAVSDDRNESRAGSQTAPAAIAAGIIARDPFRLDRRPSTIAFGGPAASPVPADPSRRPRISVSGVFGPPWQAVLEGIPGREGSVVARVGDVFGDLRVRSIRRDTVVVQGADTTWKLTVRHIW